MSKTQKIFRAVYIAAAIILLPAWFYYGLLENTYVTWPRQPQPEINRTIPYSAKGIAVYITKADQQLNVELMWTLIGSGLVFVAGLIFSGELRRIMNGDRSPKSN
ncbi:MAG: hypothetical protein WA792_10245 [Pseudolabrys sp.]